MSGRYFLGKASRFRFSLVVGAFLLLSGSTIAAEYRFDDLCRAAYREVLCLRFTEAQRLITEEKRKDPGNPVPAYLENYIDFLTLVIGEEPGKYQELKENRTARIRILEAGPENSPYHDFLLGEVYLQWAIARLKFRDYTTAAWEIRKAYSLFTGNATRFPSFRANKVGLGVVRVVIGLVPAEYRWIVSLSGMEGSLRQGISDIREVADYSGSDPLTRMYRPQALFYLAFLTVNFEKDKQEALNIPLLGVGSETGEQPFESPLLIYARAVVLMRNGLNDKALEVLEQRKSSAASFPFCYLDYLEGTARINRLDPGASVCFEKYVSKFRGITYIRSAYHKMAWAALLRGDSAGYTRIMKKVSVMGTAMVDEDRQAGAEAAAGHFPNLFLLRSRLLFDGGYYSKALAELLDRPLKELLHSKRDRLEYTYRLGRIYHETGNMVRAVACYRQTLAAGADEPAYFAAASAYQLGLLFENSGNAPGADSAYRACLALKPSEYRTSLHQKARTALKRLEKNED